MAKGVIRKIVGTGTIGAGIGAAQAALGNALGPKWSVDPGMNHYEALQTLAQWQPEDVGTAAAIGGAIGLTVGLYNRHQEFKKEQEGHNERNLGRQWNK